MDHPVSMATAIGFGKMICAHRVIWLMLPFILPSLIEPQPIHTLHEAALSSGMI
jgi:hypothetical protein